MMFILTETPEVSTTLSLWLEVYTLGSNSESSKLPALIDLLSLQHQISSLILAYKYRLNGPSDKKQKFSADACPSLSIFGVQLL